MYNCKSIDKHNRYRCNEHEYVHIRSYTHPNDTDLWLLCLLYAGETELMSDKRKSYIVTYISNE